MTIKLGDLVCDSVTGFSGIATTRAEYLHGSPRIMIEARVEPGGKPIEPGWFEESRVKSVETTKPEGTV